MEEKERRGKFEGDRRGEKEAAEDGDCFGILPPSCFGQCEMDFIVYQTFKKIMLG